MTKTIVPPIKSQGIKTKLVPWINDIIRRSGLDLGKTNWIEPFFWYWRGWLECACWGASVYSR